MTHRKICKGSPQRNVPNEGGSVFFGDFRPICRHIWKTVHFRHKVTMGRNRKPYVSYRMVSLSMTLSDPDPGFKVTVVLKGEYLQSDAFYTHCYYIGRNRTLWHAIDRQPSELYSLQTHCSYVNRANFSQASRGFVSDSWDFLYLKWNGSFPPSR